MKKKLLHNIVIENILDYKKTWDFAIYAGVFISIIILFMNSNIISSFISYDVTCLICGYIYKYIYVKGIKNGTVKAFYRKDYGKIYIFIRCIYEVFLIGIFRCILLIPAILISAYRKDYDILITGIIGHNNIKLIIFVLGLLFIYLLYYCKRDMSVEEYTKYIEIIYSNRRISTLNSANKIFLEAIEKQKYDYEMGKPKEFTEYLKVKTVTISNNEKCVENKLKKMTENTNECEFVNFTEEFVRRKPRNLD